MQKVPKYLLEEIVSFVQGLSDVDQFQKWLYEQEDLVKKIISDNFIYELFSLNYTKKEVRYELKKITIAVVGEEHFRVHQIKKSLKAILNNEGDLCLLLEFFNALCGYRGYEFLSNLGWCYYVMDEYDRYEVSFPKEIKTYYLQESKTLLEQLENKVVQGCENITCLDIQQSAPPTFGLPYHLYNSRNKKSLEKKAKKKELAILTFLGKLCKLTVAQFRK